MSSSTPQALVAVTSQLWHNRLSHPNAKILSFLRSNKLLILDFRFKPSFCKGCALGKSTHLPFERNKIDAAAPFTLIHSDVWMSPTISVSGFRYYVLFIDDYSRYSWIFPMKRKSEVFTHFKSFLATIKNIFKKSIKYFQSDGGTEYVN